MYKTDLLIIGGSAGGILSATTARKAYGDIDITIIRETEKVMVPCGIPYIFGTLRDVNKNVISDTGLINANIKLVIDKVTKIDRDAKTVTTKENKLIHYKKLILATGSLPIIPTFIEGYNLKNIFPVYKDKDYLSSLYDKIEIANDIVVVGGGFIGIEFAEQIRKLGKNVTLIEVADSCLWQAFDKKYSDEIELSLRKSGIKVLTNTKVVRFLGKEKIEAVEIDNGQKIPTQLVVLGMGVKPNAELATKSGIATNTKGAIIVDEYTRTNDKNIFAIGDCSEKNCFFTRKDVPVLLASTAAMEAKIAGCNAFHLRLIRANKGTISAFSTQVYGRTYAAAGLTESRAIEEGFCIMIGEFSTTDRHPATLPNTSKVNIKLIFSKCSGVILGAQLSGGESVGEMINTLSLAIQKGLTASDLNTFQVATHPLLSASPVQYPINAASMNAIASNCQHLNKELKIK